MSPQTRTPRQRQGDGLVPVLVRLKPDVVQALWAEAAREKMSVAAVTRVILDAWLAARTLC